jgi:response regulator RpfG family c-di-GMP phosphodiesterase
MRLGKVYDYDIILLDLNLPDVSGFEVLRSLRVSKVKTPILIISGLVGIQDKVKGLGFGADDYMTKPLHKNELVARIHAIVRRSKGHAQSVIQTGDLVINLDTKTVEIDGQYVHLTRNEYHIVELLSLRKGITLGKEARAARTTSKRLGVAVMRYVNRVTTTRKFPPARACQGHTAIHPPQVPGESLSRWRSPSVTGSRLFHCSTLLLIVNPRPRECSPRCGRPQFSHCAK